MPRKTREQKMAAALRRLKKQAQLQRSPAVNKEPAARPKEAAVQTSNYNVGDLGLAKETLISRGSAKPQTQNYDYVKSDVRKIFVLSAIAVTLEVVLSLTTRFDFAKVLLRRFGIEI